MNRRVIKGVGIGVAVAALVYLGIVIYADWNALRQALGRFEWLLAAPVLALSLGNYVLRELRWEIYLGRSRLRLPDFLAARIFFAGLVMSVTPGKMGELLKAYLVRSHSGVPVTRTGPIVVAERLTDLVALFILISAGSLLYRTAYLTAAAAGVVTLVLLAALASPHAATVVLGGVERLPLLQRYGVKLENALASMRFLLRPGTVLQATSLGVAAWFAECLGFALVLRGFGIDVDLAYAIFVYALATLVGALVLLPGGLGGTEVTMVFMLVDAGAAKELAAAATLVTRVATLWFAVLLGALVLFLDPRVTVPAEDFR